MKRIAPIRVIACVVLAACGAWCQSERSADDLLQRDGSNSPEVQHQEARTWKSLPDAPSTVQPPEQAEKFRMVADETRTPLAPVAVGINARVMREAGSGYVAPKSQPTFAALYKPKVTHEGSSNFVGRYLYPSLLKPNLRYYPSPSGSFMNRAMYAASGIFVTRDGSGKKRLNTSYFLRVVTSVATHNASRAYWRRSTAAPFNDFGSTVGNDAGLNLFHEFEPGIRQMVKGHTPKFALRIGERIIPDQHLRQVASSPAR